MPSVVSYLCCLFAAPQRFKPYDDAANFRANIRDPMEKGGEGPARAEAVRRLRTLLKARCAALSCAALGCAALGCHTA